MNDIIQIIAFWLAAWKSVASDLLPKVATQRIFTNNIIFVTGNIIFVTGNIFLLPVTRYKIKSIWFCILLLATKKCYWMQKNVVSNKKQHWRNKLTFSGDSN